MGTEWHHARAETVENLIGGVEQAQKLHPGKIILLDGVGTDLFFAGVADVPFRALEIPPFYLAPGSEASIQAPPDLVSKFVMPEGLARKALDENRVEVYDASGKTLRNATALYRGAWKAGPPRMVNPGDSLFDGQLSGEWGPPRDGVRVMGGKATIRIAGPRTPGDALHGGVYCATPPVRLTVEVAGRKAVETLTRCDGIHTFTVALPAGLGEEIDVRLKAEPVGRVAIGYLEVR